MTDPMTPAEIAAGRLNADQKQAVIEGRVHDCPYQHPVGTRCPNCAGWPFKKGGAAAFVAETRAILEKENSRAE